MTISPAVKILITNIVTLNAGDAAILYAMVDLLRAAFGKETEFVVYDSHGEVAGRYYPDLAFRKLLHSNLGSYRINLLGRRLRAMRLFGLIDKARFYFGLWCVRSNLPLIPGLILTRVELRDLKEYNSADIIVSSGGTYLVENYSLSHRVFDYRLSLYLKRPLIFFTQSLGPFSNPANRSAFKEIFNESPLILVRDQKSLDNLIDVGVNGASVHIAADAAFALADPAALKAAKIPSKRRGSPLRAAVSVREWRHFKTMDPADGMRRYTEALRALTTHLIETHGAEVTFLSTCQGMPEYWTDDSKTARRVVEGLPDRVKGLVTVNAEFHHPKDLTDLLRGYDLVIATRMHMAILALGVGTPVLPIAYEFKMSELFERLGIGHWVQDIEEVSAESIVRAADTFIERLPEIREPLFAAIERERESALGSVELVKKSFEQWQQSRHGKA